MCNEKRKQILYSAMKQFNETGFHSTPTSKIAKAAKVSVGTLFNYFSSKEKLIEEIYIHIKLHPKMKLLKCWMVTSSGMNRRRFAACAFHREDIHQWIQGQCGSGAN